MNVKHIDGITILTTNPRLDVINATNLYRKVQELAVEGRTRLLVDMNNTIYIDSSGLQALLRAQKALSEYHGEMKIARTNPQVYNVMKLVGFNKIVGIHDTVDDAMQSFSTFPDQTMP